MENKDSYNNIISQLKGDLLKDIKNILNVVPTYYFKEPVDLTYSEGDVASNEKCIFIKKIGDGCWIGVENNHSMADDDVDLKKYIKAYTLESLANLHDTLYKEVTDTLNMRLENVLKDKSRITFDGTYKYAWTDTRGKFRTSYMESMLLISFSNRIIIYATDGCIHDTSCLSLEELSRMVQYVEKNHMKRKYKVILTKDIMASNLDDARDEFSRMFGLDDNDNYGISVLAQP